MADYTQLLEQLKNTEGWFQRETEPYKNFRDALKNLNNGMRSAGNRALSAAEVQRLRELSAKAKEAWDIYSGHIWEIYNQGVPGDLPAQDRRRMGILYGMDVLLNGDLNALRNYDPARGLTLPQIIDENRGLSADVRGKDVPLVGGATNSRMVLDVNGVKGAFTEDYAPEDPETARDRYIEKYPPLAGLLSRNFPVRLGDLPARSPEELERAILTKSSPALNQIVKIITERIQNTWHVPFPREYQREDGKVWFENPAFVHAFADAAFHIGEAEKVRNSRQKASIEAGRNIPRRNAAMSMVADRLGMSGLIARSKVMKVKTDQGEKTGVFMEWARGTDIARDIRGIMPGITGQPRNYNSAAFIKAGSDLQALDYICGNGDRHGANILYRFEDVNGVKTLVGLQGIDNDASFGLADGRNRDGDWTLPESMRVMRRSTAEAILHLTKEELRYSLYGLVQDDEIDFAWERTERLQNTIRASLGRKWKSETSLQKGAIHILDDNAPAWGKLEILDLKSNTSNHEYNGFFTSVGLILNPLDTEEKNKGLYYGPHTREGIKKDYYKATAASTVFEYLQPVDYPRTGGNLSDQDIFLFYRNRRTLHEDQAAMQKAVGCFNRIIDNFRWNQRVATIQIHDDMGWTDPVDAVFIDGMPAAEYVRKYSPENAGNKNYQKAQVMAALTSGRHHVDVAVLRTRADGTFQVSASELTMDLSALNGQTSWPKSTREDRRKSLVKDEDARIARQLAIEDKVLKEANRIGKERVEERIADDPVRNQVFASMHYRLFYWKDSKEREKILDQEIARREKERLHALTEKAQFDAAKKAIGEKPAGQAGPAAGAGANAAADAGRQRERISLEALNVDAPARRPAGNQHVQNQQAPDQQVPDQHVPQHRNEAPARGRSHSFG